MDELLRDHNAAARAALLVRRSRKMCPHNVPFSSYCSFCTLSTQFGFHSPMRGPSPLPDFEFWNKTLETFFETLPRDQEEGPETASTALPKQHKVLPDGLRRAQQRAASRNRGRRE